jgi:hypothetical protein
MVNELFISYLWKNQLFNHENLLTSAGDPVSIIHPGIENSNAGADFQQAKIRINELDWVGTVELHINSSDWIQHAHQKDPAYENVILHVVWNDDLNVKYPNGASIPSLCLSTQVSPETITSYEVKKLAGNGAIPCSSMFESVSFEIKEKMISKCLLERHVKKVNQINQLLVSLQGDWEETFYQSLAKSFGFSVNADPMFRLAQSMPLKLILRYRDRNNGIEASLFGLAGLLDDDLKDEYQWELRREFIHLKKKHDWPNTYLNHSDWKFLRMRPPNFPTVRIAQFAELIRSNCSLISLLLEMQELQTIATLFETPLNEYWQTHYHFGKIGKGNHSVIGQSAFESICINTLIPMLICYSHYKNESKYKEKALRWMREIKSENNFITRIFNDHGLKLKHSGDSQGCIQWYQQYCQAKKCAQCYVGIKLMVHS